jgi:hypothetical protein
MAETLNESVARQEATNETLTNRMHTLEEFYTEKYNLLKGISETHPDCFKTPFKLVSFAEAKESIPTVKDKSKTLNMQIDKLSEFYVGLMNQYEHIKDTHPEYL